MFGIGRAIKKVTKPVFDIIDPLRLTGLGSGSGIFGGLFGSGSTPVATTAPTVATVVPTTAPSLADATAQQVAASSRRRNIAAGTAQTILGGNLGAATTQAQKTLLGQ